MIVAKFNVIHIHVLTNHAGRTSRGAILCFFNSIWILITSWDVLVRIGAKTIGHPVKCIMLQMLISPPKRGLHPLQRIIYGLLTMENVAVPPSQCA